MQAGANVALLHTGMLFYAAVYNSLLMTISDGAATSDSK